MFLRTHRVGRSVYTEALESYRDPVTGRPKHRCIGRWKADQPFAVALGAARFSVETATHNLAYWQGVIDRTVRPNFWKHPRRAPENAKFWRRHLDRSTAHLAALEAVAAKLGPVEADVQAGIEAARQRWNRAMPPQFTAPAAAPGGPVHGRAASVARSSSDLLGDRLGLPAGRLELSAHRGISAFSASSCARRSSAR